MSTRLHKPQRDGGSTKGLLYTTQCKTEYHPITVSPPMDVLRELKSRLQLEAWTSMENDIIMQYLRTSIPPGA